MAQFLYVLVLSLLLLFGYVRVTVTGEKTTIILSSIPSCDIARRVTSREREAAPLAASVEPFIKFKHLDVRHPSRHRPEVSHRS